MGREPRQPHSQSDPAVRQEASVEDHSADDYFAEIEAHFAHRRGTSFVFSSKDWMLMKSWHEQGIPLAIVLEAIDACFDKRAESGRRSGAISSLSYCRHAVLDIWDERKDQFVGREGSVPEADPAGGLGALEAALRESAGSAEAPLRPGFDAALDEIAALAKSPHAVPEIEQELIAIEGRLIDALLGALPDNTRDEMLAAIDRELARYAMPDEETRLKTRDANLRRLVRRKLSLPRLSLFG